MIYKKIGNKIPSLSSLLLAGVVFASGCSKNDGKGEERDVIEEVEGDDPNKLVVNATGNDKNLPAKTKLLVEVVKAFRKIITNAAPFTHLQNSDYKSQIVDPSFFNKDKANACTRFKKSLAEFADTKKYSPNGQKELSLLDAITIDNLKAADPKDLCVLVKFVNKINECYDSMSKIFKSICDLDDGVAPMEDYTSLVSKQIDPLLDMLSIQKPDYLPKQSFSTDANDEASSKNNSFDYKNEKLSRLMTDKKKGQPKGSGSGSGHAYGFPSVFEAELPNSIWLKPVNESSVPHYTNPASDVSKKGVPMLSSFYIYGSPDDQMPIIDHLRNNSSVAILDTKYFQDQDINTLKEFTSKAFTDATYAPDGDYSVLSTYLDPGKTNEINETNTIQEVGTKNLKVNTLFWLLFANGTGEFDFLNVKFRSTKSKKDQATKVLVEFISDNYKFQSLLSYTNDKPIFAKTVGQYIEKTEILKNNLCVPSYNQVFESIFGLAFQETIKTCEEKVDSKVGSSFYLDITGKKILAKKDSVLGAICQGIYNAFGFKAPSDDQLFEQLTKIKELTTSSLFQKAALTIPQRIALRLAELLLERKSAWIEGTLADYRTKTDLIKMIEKWINSELETHTIVFKDKNDNYVATPASNAICDAVVKLFKVSQEKKSNGYRKIGDVLSKFTDLKEFKVDSVMKACFEQVLKLKASASAPILVAVAKDGPIDSSDLPNMPWLFTKDYSCFNDLKDTYQTKVAALEAKVPQPNKPK